MSYKTDLKKRAILVDFDGGHFNWNKRDGSVEREVAQSKNVNRSVGSYHKNIFYGCDGKLEHIRRLVSNARRSHEEITVPWEAGKRLLLNANFMKFQQEMAKAMSDLSMAKAELAKEWDSMMLLAERTLGPMYRKEDYPTLDQVLDSCFITIKTYALSDAEDVRIDLPDSFVETLKQEVAKTQASQYAAAVESTWLRLYKVLEQATANLGKRDGSKGTTRFRTEWYFTLGALLPALKGLNVNDDPRLTELADRCQALLAYPADDYKLSVTQRQEAYAKAQSIFDDLAKSYTPDTGLKE